MNLVDPLYCGAISVGHLNSSLFPNGVFKNGSSTTNNSMTSIQEVTCPKGYRWGGIANYTAEYGDEPPGINAYVTCNQSKDWIFSHPGVICWDCMPKLNFEYPN